MVNNNGSTLYEEADCLREFFFICEEIKSVEKRPKRSKRTVETTNDIISETSSQEKKYLIRAYNKANSSVHLVEQEAEQIRMKVKAGKTLDPAMAHAIFLSGKDDRYGNLMNKLALINIETMKMAKQNGY